MLEETFGRTFASTNNRFQSVSLAHQTCFRCVEKAQRESGREQADAETFGNRSSVRPNQRKAVLVSLTVLSHTFHHDCTRSSLYFPGSFPALLSANTLG